MLWGGADGGRLELRRQGGGARLSGSFPYGRPATLSDGGRTGRPRKEVIAPRAFAYRVERSDEDIHLLSGHDYGKPLASRGAGTLDLSDGDDALRFEANIRPEIADTSHGRDALAMIEAGLAVGLSPGFRLPPKRAVPEPERIEDEDPAEGQAIIRTVLAALLYELSLVTRAAYKDAQVEKRCWAVPKARMICPPRYRWRA